ncbi:tissue inhibitor of metalloproteinase [Hermetia illucens]|nr:tissue inhibitor of metalloproteinase [Hermetia illucens]
MTHNKLFGALILGILFVISTHIAPTEGCSCSPKHPQSFYCEADFVIIARILRKSVISKPYQNTYKIDIKKAYKMSEKAKSYLKEGRIMTAKSESMCGLTLEIGKIYVIAGKNGPTVNLCNYVKAYKDMTTVERRGFAGLYRKGCNACSVRLCFYQEPYACEDYPDSCVWNPFKRCETKYSFCAPSGRGGCHWRYTPAYKECIREP